MAAFSSRSITQSIEIASSPATGLDQLDSIILKNIIKPIQGSPGQRELNIDRILSVNYTNKSAHIYGYKSY